MQHIKNIAKQHSEQNPCAYGHDWTDEYYKQLMQLREALEEGRFYGRIDRVSQSGMTRWFSVAYIKDNELHHVAPWILKELGRAEGQHGDKVSGCGFDAVHHIQYNLWVSLFPRKPYQKMPSYRSY